METGDRPNPDHLEDLAETWNELEFVPGRNKREGIERTSGIRSFCFKVLLGAATGGIVGDRPEGSHARG
jgi:hypothetical protein